MINLFNEGNEWSVWMDCDGTEKDGLCIGISTDKFQALAEAETELKNHLAMVESMREPLAAAIHVTRKAAGRRTSGASPSVPPRRGS